MTETTNHETGTDLGVGVDAVVIRCVLTAKELQDAPLTDDFVLPRMLVAKGFHATGGPLQPALKGQIGYTVDFETGNYHYFQTGV